MTPAEFNACLKRAHLPQVALQRLLRLNKATTSRWAHGERAIPSAVAVLVRGLASGAFTLDTLEYLKEDWRGQ